MQFYESLLCYSYDPFENHWKLYAYAKLVSTFASAVQGNCKNTLMCQRAPLKNDKNQHDLTAIQTAALWKPAAKYEIKSNNMNNESTK